MNYASLPPVSIPEPDCRCAVLIGLRVGSEIAYRSIDGVRHVAGVESLGAPPSSNPRKGTRS